MGVWDSVLEMLTITLPYLIVVPVGLLLIFLICYVCQQEKGEGVGADFMSLNRHLALPNSMPELTVTPLHS